MERKIFARLQEKALISNFDHTNRHINILHEEVTRAFNEIKDKSEEAKQQKDRVYKALTRI